MRFWGGVIGRSQAAQKILAPVSILFLCGLARAPRPSGVGGAEKPAARLYTHTDDMGEEISAGDRNQSVPEEIFLDSCWRRAPCEGSTDFFFAYRAVAKSVQ